MKYWLKDTIYRLIGCCASQLNDIENDDGSTEHPLNEEKSEYSSLPSVTMILGEKIEKYFNCDKVLGIVSLHS